MKKGYVKSNWAPMVIVALFAIGTAYSGDFWIGVLTLFVAGTLVYGYIKFDEDEKMHDEWWNALSKDEKREVYGKIADFAKDKFKEEVYGEGKA